MIGHNALPLQQAETLWKLHTGLPAWFADVAVRLAGSTRRIASLYALRRALDDKNVSIQALREVFQTFSCVGLTFEGRTHYRVAIPDSLRRFWSLVIVPSLGADEASLSSYAAHMGCLSRKSILSDPELALFAPASLQRKGLPALRHDVLLSFFSSPSIIKRRQRRLFRSLHVDIPAESDTTWPDSLSFSQIWHAATLLGVHPISRNIDGQLCIHWRAARPMLPETATVSCAMRPYGECLPPIVFPPPGQEHASTWACDALHAVYECRHAKELLGWWTKCTPKAIHKVHNYYLYCNTRGDFLPLLIPVRTDALFQHLLVSLINAKALVLEEEGLRLTELGLNAGQGGKPPARLVRIAWSRTSLKLTISLASEWPPEALHLLRQLGSEINGEVTVTPQSLAASKCSPEESIALLEKFYHLSSAARSKLLNWQTQSTGGRE